MASVKHLKDKCIGCERTRKEVIDAGIKFNKEHLSAEWLVKRTGTDKTYVSWMGKKVHGLSVTIPLCEECNTLFGNRLEAPVVKIFDLLESGQGITDYQAEILIRWMWKFEGIHWHLRNVGKTYSEKYTLKDRVLNKIDEIRPYLILSVAVIDEIDEEYGDLPMGIDSLTQCSGLFVSGVFSKLAIMTCYKDFEKYIPDNFSSYRLARKLNKKRRKVVFIPKIGFKDDTEAVTITLNASKQLQFLHDEFHINLYQ